MRTILSIGNCATCSSPFNITTKKPKQQFCSRACKDINQKTGKLLSCNMCGKSTYKPLARIRETFFCSLKCSNGSRLKIGNCINCNKLISGKSRKYCSIKCQGIIKQIKTETIILAGQFKGSRKTLRDYLIRHQGQQCEKCKLTFWNEKEIPIEINHIDGNSDNNKLENVELLCPNCHAQTSTYKGRNRGNGRFKRRERYRAGLSY